MSVGTAQKCKLISADFQPVSPDPCTTAGEDGDTQQVAEDRAKLEAAIEPVLHLGQTERDSRCFCS